MIVVTGAAGFIGSALLGELERMGYGDLIAVDDFSVQAKSANYQNKRITQFVERSEFFGWLSDNSKRIQFIFHIGARTRTDEFDEAVLQHLNVEYSQKMWQACVDNNIPLIYASSAATYGDGTQGFSDEPASLDSLRPLNPYGNSKHRFDLWVMEQKKTPPFWAGFKFFNVFGPNEYHKGRMASVVFHAYNQIKETGHVSLFRSHNKDFANGAQERDFIYVKDVLSVMMHFWFIARTVDCIIWGQALAGRLKIWRMRFLMRWIWRRKSLLLICPWTFAININITPKPIWIVWWRQVINCPLPRWRSRWTIT
jgi:ADP-L-glycero-D-manno-heptose 6-epimerase